MSKVSKHFWIPGTLVALVVLMIAGCASLPTASEPDTVVVGMAHRFGGLDPAGPVSDGSTIVQTQLFARLLTSTLGGTAVRPDLADTARFTSPTSFTVTLRPGLQFANGDHLTSSDVVFSIHRLLAIKAVGSAASLLGNLASVSAPDERTVVFHLLVPNDQTFARVLSTVAGTVVDEQVFSAHSLTGNDSIIARRAFSGRYFVDSYAPTLITFSINTRYRGGAGRAISKIALKSYADPHGMELDLHDGVIDVAGSGLTSDEISTVIADSHLRLVDKPGAQLRALVFDSAAMPFGSAQRDASAAKALAVRRAVAELLDRSALAEAASGDAVEPLFAYVPEGVSSLAPVMKSGFGNGSGGPDPLQASKILFAASVKTPVALPLFHGQDPASIHEFEVVKAQLESAGLFTVTSGSAARSGTRPLGVSEQIWSTPIADPDPYLRRAIASSGSSNPAARSQLDAGLAAALRDPDPTGRLAQLDTVEGELSAQALVVPLLQGLQVAATGTRIRGVTWDSSSALVFADLRWS
jgi:peptide/nickel transport system substrate-binding protein